MCTKCPITIIKMLALSHVTLGGCTHSRAQGSAWSHIWTPRGCPAPPLSPGSKAHTEEPYLQVPGQIRPGFGVGVPGGFQEAQHHPTLRGCPLKMGSRAELGWRGQEDSANSRRASSPQTSPRPQLKARLHTWEQRRLSEHSPAPSTISKIHAAGHPARGPCSKGPLFPGQRMPGGYHVQRLAREAVTERGERRGPGRLWEVGSPRACPAVPECHTQVCLTLNNPVRGAL